MNARQGLGLAVVAMLLTTASGCGWCCKSRCCPPSGSSYGPVVTPVPPATSNSQIFGAPPQTQPNPPSFYAPPATSSPLPHPPTGTAPPPESTWEPSPRGPIVNEIPERSEAGKSKPPGGAKLMPPAEEDRPASPGSPPPAEAPKFSADIPKYNIVYENVSAGIQPFPEGFTWLKSSGYRTIVFLRTPGEDDSVLRTEVEAKGMRFVSMEIGPKTLTREQLQEFGRIIRDTNGHPLFVFDRKGMPAGAVWYLHFRLNDNEPEAQARGRATRLGLKDDQSGDHAELWLAINKLLAGT